jgi:hypothetical protein
VPVLLARICDLSVDCLVEGMLIGCYHSFLCEVPLSFYDSPSSWCGPELGFVLMLAILPLCECLSELG